jgi:hypothetical protein
VCCVIVGEKSRCQLIRCSIMYNVSVTDLYLYAYIGPRYNNACANIKTSAGLELPWLNEIHYLGIFFTSSTRLRFSVNDYAKRSFYRAANAIFGKDGII